MRSSNKNRRPADLLVLLVAPVALFSLSGCGGGGGSDAASSAAGLTRSAALDVYVTDGFNDNYKQVLTTLYKIELTTDKTTYQTVFTSDTGQTINLSSLKDTAELLASLNIPEGSYTEARITVGDKITLVTKSGQSSVVAVDASAGTVTNGQATLSIPASTKVVAGQAATIVIDFRLAEFTLTGKGVRPKLVAGDEAACAGKEREGHLGGTVANLVEGVSFDLTGRGNRVTKVTLSDTTTITNGETGVAATLANGLTVQVEGAVDAATKTIAATAVTVGDFDNGGRPGGAARGRRASGTVASVDATAKSFTLIVDRADDLQPTGGTITVQADDKTRFPKGRRATGIFADVVVGAEVHVGGAFDAATQTLTARMVGLGGESGEPGETPAPPRN